MARRAAFMPCASPPLVRTPNVRIWVDDIRWILPHHSGGINKTGAGERSMDNIIAHLKVYTEKYRMRRSR
jgi:hypothetical protein